MNLNSCLGRTIAIFGDGTIKHCPCFSFMYGNIWNSDVRKIPTLPMYRFFLSLTKDKISICKDCELRNTCLDCGFNICGNMISFSKPIFCSYNPYD